MLIILTDIDIKSKINKFQSNYSNSKSVMEPGLHDSLSEIELNHPYLETKE